MKHVMRTKRGAAVLMHATVNAARCSGHAAVMAHCPLPPLCCVYGVLEGVASGGVRLGRQPRVACWQTPCRYARYVDTDMVAHVYTKLPQVVVGGSSSPVDMQHASKMYNANTHTHPPPAVCKCMTLGVLHEYRTCEAHATRAPSKGTPQHEGGDPTMVLLPSCTPAQQDKLPAAAGASPATPPEGRWPRPVTINMAACHGTGRAHPVFRDMHMMSREA